MAKQPAQRYGSVEALRADLDRWLAGQPVEARVPSAVYRMRKFAQRHRLGVALGAGAVLSLIGITAVAVVMGLQAREDSARAGAARDFMLGLFKRADQEKARGADITARELLETGRKDVLTRLAAQPRLQAELLQGIGAIQNDMGEYVGADSTYADAARIYGQLGKPRDAALARIAQADAAVRMGDMTLAQNVLQQVKDMRDRPADDPDLNARMGEIAGWIAISRSDASGARDLFRQSLEQALKAFGPYHLKVIGALRGQATAEGQLRNFDEALRLLDRLEATAAKTSGVDARMLPGLAKERAILLLAAGRWAESLEQSMAVLPKCVADLGPNHSECRELMFYKVNAMLRLGMTRVASDLPSLQAMADDQKSPALGADTLLLILKLESLTGTSAGQAAAFERLRSLIESVDGIKFGPGFRARAMLVLAEAKLRANDASDAERWIAKALALLRRDDGSLPATASVAIAKSLQGIVLLRRGRSADAFESLRAAHDDASKLLGPDDPTTRLFSLNAALALEALGRVDEALALVEQAGPPLHKAMGSDSPAYLRVKELQGRLEQLATSGVALQRNSNPSVPGSSAAKYPHLDFFS